MTHALESAREAFARQAWTQAFDTFAVVGQLERGDHERFAVAAYLTGADDQCERAWEDAHRAALAAGDAAEAARCAFWLALGLMQRGQVAQAGGWLRRMGSILAEADVVCTASGYLLIPELLGALHGGDAAGARDLAVRAIEFESGSTMPTCGPSAYSASARRSSLWATPSAAPLASMR